MSDRFFFSDFSLSLNSPPVCFSPHRNMLLCSSVWMPPLCLKKSYAMPGPFPSSGIVLDLPCKYSVSSHSYLFAVLYSNRKRNVLFSVTTFQCLPLCNFVIVKCHGRVCACVCVLLQYQRRFCGTQPNFSTRRIPATIFSLQGRERGGE